MTLLSRLCSLLKYRRRPLTLVLITVTGLLLLRLLNTELINDSRKDHQGLADTGEVGMRKRSNSKQTQYVDKNRMQVVVGKYVGDRISQPGSIPNLTRAELNANNYWPVATAGENGQAVFLTPRENRMAKRLWHINKFNIVASDKIPLNRSLPEVRKKICQDKLHAVSSLPQASIIIVFHNEAWSTLVRTVHSVINRSPRSTLAEIILVDDASERTFLGEPLEEHLKTELGDIPAKIIRSRKRVGLIKARLLGAEAAIGEVLLFLDAHCEATNGWIEPLLSRIRQDPTAVVCPIIDIINDETFQYVKAFALHWGGFNWELHFRWFTMSHSLMEEFKEHPTEPYRTPAMAGGLFAIDRKFFHKIGSYDEEMDIWGGENLEMSFRIWMCGGSVEIAPCSRVGHVFRSASPYTFPRKGGVNGVLHSNLARVALTWMDDYAKFYFMVNDYAKKAATNQDVSQRLKLRERLQCRDFDWYLSTVWPEHFFPTPERLFGKIKHLASEKCVQKPFKNKLFSSVQPTGSSSLEDCVATFYPPQEMVMTSFFDNDSFEEGEDEVAGGYIMTDENVCLDSPTAQHDTEPAVKFQACNEMDRQKWIYDPETQKLTHSESRLCVSRSLGGTSDELILKDCKATNQLQQKWQLIRDKW